MAGQQRALQVSRRIFGRGSNRPRQLMTRTHPGQAGRSERKRVIRAARRAVIAANGGIFAHMAKLTLEIQARERSWKREERIQQLALAEARKRQLHWW